MIVGTMTFICDNCGHKFKGLAMVYMASAFIAPVKCYKCGSW